MPLSWPKCKLRNEPKANRESLSAGKRGDGSEGEGAIGKGGLGLLVRAFLLANTARAARPRPGGDPLKPK